MSAQIYQFHEGCLNDYKILGKKGAYLCEMYNLGIPVPPGFIITSEVCEEIFNNGFTLPSDLIKKCKKEIENLELTLGKQFSESNNPLFISVRSSSKYSMPGMLDTVLNVGINNKVFKDIFEMNNDFALSTYLSFLKSFSTSVYNIEGREFEQFLIQFQEKTHTNFKVQELQNVLNSIPRKTDIFQLLTPQKKYQQLQIAIESVFRSWTKKRVVCFREYFNIANKLDMAVVVQAMVFGNRGMRSGSGVILSYDPITGRNSITGEFVLNSVGIELMSGNKTPIQLSEFKKIFPDIFYKLTQILIKLEDHFNNRIEIEFVVEEDQLFILQSRIIKYNPKKKNIQISKVENQSSNKRESHLNINDENPNYDYYLNTNYNGTLITEGLPASPGIITGMVVFSADDIEKLSKHKKDIILVKHKTNTDDIIAIRSASGIITSVGGFTSHAAVTARAMEKICVTGCSDIIIDNDNEFFTTKSGIRVNKYDIVTINGFNGRIYLECY